MGQVSRAGQNRASVRETTTTTGGCDKQRKGGSAAERPIDGRTNEQLNEQTSQENNDSRNSNDGGRNTKGEHKAEHSKKTTRVVYCLNQHVTLCAMWCLLMLRTAFVDFSVMLRFNFIFSEIA